MLAFLYDRVNTRFGKIRILMVAGFVIESIALWLMYSGMSSKGFGVPVFVILYIVYVIGYTITNMTAQTIPNIMTNDPKQRPTLSVWTTAFNYLVPMVLSIVFSAVLLPMFGGEYNQEFLTAACLLCIAVGAVGTVLVCIGVSEYDRPENFRGVSAKKEKLSMKDMAGDALTAGVFWVAMAVKFGLPILGWIVTLFAMRYSPISKEGMIDVQKRIEGKKAEIAQEA